MTAGSQEIRAGGVPVATRWGWLVPFETPDALLAAVRCAREAGRQVRAFAPHHVEGLSEALGDGPPRIAGSVFIGALVGGVGGYLMQWWSAVHDRPVDVGGRPLHSAPMFIPVTFELAVLFGAFAAVLAWAWRCGLPRLRHPLFDAPGFGRVTHDRYAMVLMDAGEDEAAPWFDGATSPAERIEVAR